MEKALACFEKVLALAEKQEEPDLVARTLLNLALAHHNVGHLDRAVELFRLARKKNLELEAAGPAALALSDLAAVLRDRGENDAALEAARRALAEAEDIDSVEIQVEALYQIANTQYFLGDYTATMESARTGIDRAGSMFRGLADEQSARFRTRYRRLFRIGFAAAVEADEIPAALSFSEAGRAGALLEILGGREVTVGLEIPKPLLDAEARARAAVEDARRQHAEALAARKLREIVKTKKALEAARADLEQAVERIQRESKAAADLAYPRPASLPEVQGWLGKDEALVLYAWEYRDVFALVITAGGGRLVSLGKIAPIEAAVADFSPATPGGDWEKPAKALADLVVAPLALPGTIRRVLVSPGGPLGEVPFAVLFGEREIAYLPSATTYGVLRDSPAGSRRGILALGDPEYPEGGKGKSLVRLPATRLEAKAVGTVTLLGADATEGGLVAALARGGGKDGWRAVHLACHGLVDTERPANSALAVTPGDGDGFLTLLEIVRMRIPADLVTLSACETARGKVYASEGAVGLPRAFMMAGAPRVICSLWKVDDEATRALMTEFYRLWNPEKGEGLPAAAALRRAQEHVRSREAWKHPAYWAAWQLWGRPD